MKKQWISVKCGLSRDPKHRQAMGESVWLFLHILDTASWDDGICHDWKDEAEAEEMGMPVRTLREHRRKLDELGYITCNQKQYTQDVIIHNWTNPREYNGQLYNPKQGDRITEPQEIGQGYIQGDTQGDIQGNRKHVTPTYDSKIKESLKSKPDFSNLHPSKYRSIPELKTFIDATGWIPGSFVLETVYDFVHAGLTFEQIKNAFSKWTARGYKSANVEGYLTWARDGIPNAYGKNKEETGPKPEINTIAVEATKQLVDDKFSGTFVPRPANLQRPRGIADVAKGLRK